MHAVQVSKPTLKPHILSIKGRVVGPLLVLICPYFRKNEIITRKIVSFLCSLDNFLLKNVTLFIFGNHISKWRSFEKKKKKLFLTYFSHV